MKLDQIRTLCHEKVLIFRNMDRFLETWEFEKTFIDADKTLRKQIIALILSGNLKNLRELCMVTDYDKSYRQLRIIARQRKVLYYGNMNKEELVRAINAKSME